MPEPTTPQFRGGPLQDDRPSRLHSLIVHMKGDGRRSVGWYEQVAPGVFEWHAAMSEPSNSNRYRAPWASEDAIRAERHIMELESALEQVEQRLMGVTGSSAGSERAIVAVKRIAHDALHRRSTPMPEPSTPHTHDEGLRAARAVAGWYLGYQSWADQLIDAYLDPDEALRKLAVAKGEEPKQCH